MVHFWLFVMPFHAVLFHLWVRMVEKAPITNHDVEQVGLTLDSMSLKQL
jgi:hypothetical protein